MISFMMILGLLLPTTLTTASVPLNFEGIGQGSQLLIDINPDSASLSANNPPFLDHNQPTAYVDPLYGYELQLEGEWYVYPTSPEAVYGVAVFENYDENQFTELGNFPQPAVRLQVGVAPLWKGWSFENWVQGWRANEIIHGATLTEPTSVSVAGFKGVSFHLLRNQTVPNQPMDIHEVLLDIGDGRVMVIISYTWNAATSKATLEMVKGLDLSGVKHFPPQLDTFGSPSLSTLLSDAESAGTVNSYGPCSLAVRLDGRGAPEAPFALHVPFKADQVWEVGWEEGKSGGSFYGNNWHCNNSGLMGRGDHYALDWNRYEKDEAGNLLPERGEDVLPVADGTIDTAIFPTCPDNNGFGCYVLINHDHDIRTLYAHLSNVYRAPNEFVYHWERIGAVGGTGGVPVHLHFGILQKHTDGNYYSRCDGSTDVCGEGESPALPQTVKPSPMYTADGNRTEIINGQDYSRVNICNGCVMLFWNPDYDAHNNQNDLGYRTFTEPGWYNLNGVFDNQVSSLKIASGRSVLLYEGSDRSGASVCVNKDVANFDGVNFPGTNVEIRGNISSIEIFENRHCLGPNTGGVIGQIKDVCGNPASGARVSIITWGGGALNLTDREVTDSNGLYASGGIPAGNALIWAVDANGTDTSLTWSKITSNQWSIANTMILEPDTCVSLSGESNNQENKTSGMASINAEVCQPPLRPPDCPQSGGAILFKDENFACGGSGEGIGYVRRDSPGLYNNVGAGFNDQASSVRVPAGWSVKLFEHENGNGGWACRNGNDANFWGDYFNNGVPLINNVTSFQVYDVPNCGPNTAPAVPTLNSPADGHAAEDGKAPALCWRNVSDPEGDQVEYYAEVYDSPVNANSGWIRSTCWRPASLDGNYHTYQWRVKARDLSHQAQSSWSVTRNFSIEAPNQPPSIAFTTANGVAIPTSRLVQSNVRDWIFQGTASDVDGQVAQIKFQCSGDNCGVAHSQNGLTTWTYERRNIAGQNNLHFLAYDDDGAVAQSGRLDLRIDLAAPMTALSLNGDSNRANWPTWFTAPVQVRLQAEDKGTGNARADVKQIHYRLNGGAWQTQSGAVKTFTVSGDGVHTVEYYAEDKVGNLENSRQVTFKLDATPPTAPGKTTETHGVLSGQWQKEWNDPNFTWAPSSDSTSGVWYYQVAWNNTLQVSNSAGYDPLPVRTGSYPLSIRAVDRAGNISAQGGQFIFKYDGTPPPSPALQNNSGIASGVWQKQVRTANFSWPVPNDEGSGIAGYNLYWGASITGTSTSLISTNSFVNNTPICAENEAAIRFLRVRSQDNVDWQSQWVDYAVAYDGAPPTASLVANYGLALTNQTSVFLDIAAADEGSGVTLMRLSSDGSNWIDWTAVVTETLWEIPALGRREHTIYLQVADKVGNLSQVVTDTVFLDVNPARPRSDNFWMWDEMVTSGGKALTSTTYSMLSSVGQPMVTGQAPGQSPVSANYKMDTGFQAGSQAAPILRPTYMTYSQTGYIVAGGGTGAAALESTGLQMRGTLGQPAGVRTITSTNFILFSGFWGGAGYNLKPPVSPPLPPPAPPLPECEFYSIAINDDVPFTVSPVVSLTLCGPDPVEMMLSNTAEFSATNWQPYTQTLAWTLAVTGTSIQPRSVFARFKDGSGAIYGDFSDDIIYDPNAGWGQAVFDLTDLVSETHKLASGMAVMGGIGTSRSMRVTNEDGVDLFLSANDDSSGLADIQVSEYSGFVDNEWQPYSAIVPVSLSQGDGVKTVYVRFRDNAGNVSEPASASLLVDTEPPFGGVAVADQIVGPKFITVTAYLGAIDELSGVADMQISSESSFTDIAWQPYTFSLSLPISITNEGQGAFFVRYRDAAGNISDIVSDTYVIDTTPPLVYVEVTAGDSLTRTVTILAHDELVDAAVMHISNDPLMIDQVTTLTYTQVITWTFDEREVVWVQVEDAVGNVSEPYPAFAGAQLMSSDLALVPGWNLVSWPLSPVSRNLTDILLALDGICDQAWTYSALDEEAPWKEWPGDLAETDETTGLWLHVTEPVSLTLSGWRPKTTEIALGAGWNLVGYPAQTAYSVEEALLSLTGKYTRVLAFDPTDSADPWKEYNVNTPSYVNDLAMLQPGLGYWINVTEACVWIVPQ